MEKMLTNTISSVVASSYKILYRDIRIHDFFSNFQLFFQPLLTIFFANKSNMQMLSPDEKDDKKLVKEDIKIIMDRLGVSYDSDEDICQERFGEDELGELFDEEPSLEEVKEAFDVFDENNDGFIDARELQRVLLGLGLKEGTQVEECRRMIKAVDDNKDGRIDFSEFVRFLEMSFC